MKRHAPEKPGADFAVVADEVRKLSNQTEISVKKIEEGILGVSQLIENQLAVKLANSSVNEERTTLEKFCRAAQPARP